MSISQVFNLADLFSYRGTFEPLVLPFSVSTGTSSTLIICAPFTALELPYEILNILDDEFVTSHSDGYRRFLVR